MPECRYHAVCGRDGGESAEEDLCILHSQNLKKDVELFRSALAEHRNSGRNDFSHFVFPVHADFGEATFTKWARFNGATFTEANFGGATFTEGADFDGATFTKWARFNGATFTEANFGEATFTEGADFGGATFTKWAVFLKATFTKGADFDMATFTDAHFAAATFTKGASFFWATFTKWARFNEATFTEEANFGGATFTEEAKFGGATFTEGADFGGATFTEGASFNGATFTKGASFGYAKFATGANFDEAKFATGANFGGAKFLGRTLFTAKRNERGPTIPNFSGAEVDFRQAVIEPLDALIFRGADLRKCQFLDTDLREAEFTNVTWPIISDEKWIGKRVGVYDEISPLAPDVGGRRYPEIERLYRELKQNYEDRRDYERAGDFHYGEKEMRRKNPETPMGLKFFLTVYWAVSGYGERYLRPLVWAGVLLVGCAFFYLLLGLVEPGTQGRRLDLIKMDDWLQSIHYSFRVMTLLKVEEVAKPDGYAKIVSTLQNLLGPLFLGLFGLALRQRLKR